MKIGHQTKFVVLFKQASSLHSLISDGLYRPTSLGRNKWKSLIGSASLQPNCNQEGFNTKWGKSDPREAIRASRIGILGNDQNDCVTCDSRIGFGTGGYPDDTNTCGNEVLFIHGGDNGEKHIKAMGYIFVQWNYCRICVLRKRLFIKHFTCCLLKDIILMFCPVKVFLFCWFMFVFLLKKILCGWQWWEETVTCTSRPWNFAGCSNFAFVYM